jgi:hypothetical protein
LFSLPRHDVFGSKEAVLESQAGKACGRAAAGQIQISQVYLIGTHSPLDFEQAARTVRSSGGRAGMAV